MCIFQGQSEPPKCVLQELGVGCGIQGSPHRRSLNELPAEARDKWPVLGWGTVPGKGTSRANEDLRGRLEQNPGRRGVGSWDACPALYSLP